MRFPVLAAMTIWVVAGFGCGSGEDRSAHVDARTENTLIYWRSDVFSRHSRDEWHDFDEAVKELRFRAMAQGATGSEAIADKVMSSINGKTFVEVLRLGDEAKLERLESTRDQLQSMIDANALVLTKGDDTESSERLRQKRLDQQERLERLLGEIAAVQQLRAKHGGPPAPATPAVARAQPRTLPREEALKSIDELIQRRRMGARERGDDSPSLVDADGAMLSGADKTNFDERRIAAAENGRSVVAVRLRHVWWIYDDAVKLPDLPDAVNANLTEEDRKEFARRWVQAEAEAWARRESALAAQATSGAQRPETGTATRVEDAAPEEMPVRVK